MDYVVNATLRLRDQFTAQMKRAIAETERLARGVSGTSKGLGDVKPLILDVKGFEKLQRLQSMLKGAGLKPPPVNVRVQDGDSTSRVSKLRGELQSLTSRAWNTTLNVKTNGLTALNKVKTQIGELASGMALGLGAGLLGTAGVGYGIVDAFQSSINFEKEMSRVQAVLGVKDKKEMRELQAEAERIGYETPFTAAQAAQAEYYMAMAGWKEPQIKAGVGGVTDLAIAGNMDIARASDVVTDLMTAMHLQAGANVKMAGKPIQSATDLFVDTMAALVTSANTDVEGAFQALKYSAPVISALFADKDIETRAQAMQDAMIMTGAMASGGIKDTQAGTALRAIFTRMAGQNRNTYFGQKALGIDLVDKETGDVRRTLDVIKDFRKAFQEGVDPEHLTDFAEEMEGTKLHADTRRKLTSLIDSVQKRGGKMGGADRAMLATMLSGQEAMSGFLNMVLMDDEDWNKIAEAIENARGKAAEMRDMMSDNFYGDLKRLGSAWDAFARALTSGSASDGLRGLVNGFTDLLTKANNLFQDGIQITDWFKLIGVGIDKLKDKFLAFDGIGSLLAGGALVMGLKKVLSLAMQLKETLLGLGKLPPITPPRIPPTTIPPLGTGTGSVGTMNVSAGVVNVNGRQNGSTSTTTTGQRQNGNTSTTTNTNTNRNSNTSTSANTKWGGAGVAVGVPAVFAVADVAHTQIQGEERIKESTAEVERQKQILAAMETTEGVSEEEKANQLEQISIAEQIRAQEIKNADNANRESIFGGVGMTAGAAAGFALGSVFPGVGNLLGGLGGLLLTMALSYGGDKLGRRAAQMVNESRQHMQENQNGEKSKYTFKPSWYMGGGDKQAQVPQYQIGEMDEAAFSEYVLRRYSQGLNRHRQERPVEEDTGFEFMSKASAATIDPNKEYKLNTPTENPSAFEVSETPDLSSKFSDWFDGFELPDLGGKINEWFSSFEMPELGISEKISSEIESSSVSFESFANETQALFSNMASWVESGAESAKSAIVSRFESAATEVQAAWNAIPGFFSGIFSGLGGAASAAGSAIYAGLTSVIGSVINAWQSAVGTISGIISSISAKASSISFPSFGIGANASGTSNWRGGWTEINERGGEIVNLPRGSQIIPHATTKKILSKEIRRTIERGDDNYHGLPIDIPDGYRRNINTTRDNLGRIMKETFPRRNETPLAGDMKKPSIDVPDGYRRNGNFTRDSIGRIFTEIFNPSVSNDMILPSDITPSIPNYNVPSSTTTTTNHANTINMGGVTINNGSDMDELMFRLQQFLTNSIINYGG